jgi:pimeloyl-ACP methyl ester carboxylesterase
MSSGRVRALLLTAFFLAMLGPSSIFAAAAPCVASAAGEDSFCDLNGLKLHFVDWGGKGPVVILLAGLGDSARIFDDFAPLLSRTHHVIALTRRGFGLSQAPADGNYTNAALVGDILGLMDALSIERASFVGHSIAGGELAALGERHPDRVERLVFIDAAYDRTRAFDIMQNLPPLPPPSPADRLDLAAFTAWREAALGVHRPAVSHDLREVTRMTPQGLTSKTPMTVSASVLEGDIAAPPHWAAIRAPQFAFYTSKDVLDQVPPAATAAQRQAFLDYSLKVIRPWMLRAQADFLEHAPCGTAIEVPHSTHYLYLVRPEWTAEKILNFLSAHRTCAHAIVEESIPLFHRTEPDVPAR